MDDLDDVVREFLIESHENLDQFERDVVALEETPGDQEIVARIFRTLHTIKGTCGFLGYSKLEALAHAGENLLSALRDGSLDPTAEMASALLSSVDAIREMLSAVETTGTDGETDWSALVQRLEGCLAGPPSEGDTLADMDWPAEPTEPERPQQNTAGSDVTPPGPVGEGEAQPPLAAAITEADSTPRATGPGAEVSVRVHVDVLDRLMNLVGELVLARNQVLRLTEGSQNSTLVATIQRLNQVTTELQEGVMTTRMQPIGNVWSKLPRVVRDLARACRKRVRVEMEGKDTGLDKTLIEAIKDPLTHLVRNAVDHGIEPPDERLAAGKDPTGLLLLRAYHEGGQVNVEISDDGGGIDPRKLLRRALERHLVPPDQVARFGERQMMNLIFLPGFSTAAKVTNVSGRGVGMDVVKTNVERIGGTIEIASEVGVGTTFKVRIPLTLAIVPALIVRCWGQRYAIPQVNLLELVRLENGQDVIEDIRGASVYQLRGRLLPLLYLEEELGIGARSVPDPAGVRHVVVLQAEAQRFGLVVDEVHDTEEIVVKPLSKQIKSAGAFAGATIMGDGQVALILDVAGIASRGHVSAQRTEDEVLEAVGAMTLQDQQCESLLMVDVGARRWALPLSRVTRLEEIEAGQVERLGQMVVVQYRGGILPLFWAARDTKQEPPVDLEPKELLHVIVFDYEGLALGMVVDRIQDIVTGRFELSEVGHDAGIIGSAIVRGTVVEVADISELARRVLGLEGPMERVA